MQEEKPERIEMLIVDDHPVIGLAISMLVQKQLRYVSVDSVENGKTAIAKLKDKKYDIILLDVHLPDYNVIDLIPNLQRLNPETKILVFTMAPENILAQKLFSMDIMGFLAKSSSNDETIEAIKTVLRGERYVSKEFTQRMVDNFVAGNKSMNPFESLSERELQVLMELLKGSPQKEIGERLSLHLSSVATYRTRIFKKLDVSNRLELYEKARLFGLV